MARVLRIGSRFVGDGHPCFVIAEAGVNHNGDVGRALDLVRAAKDAGADCVKFQTFKADRIATAHAPKARYQLGTTDPGESQRAMLQALELPEGAYREILALCNQLGIVFLSTCYSPEDADFLDELGVPAFKFASLSVVEPTFLAHVARKGKPIILSTGMATMEEVEAAVNAIRHEGLEDIVLLQCTTDYPARPADANLRAMLTLRQKTDALTGYSDHTQTPAACAAAVAMGACVIEKHFTLDTTLPGPDHASSFDPSAFAQLMALIRETELLLGSPEKKPSPAEVENARGMRRSLVARRDIKKGSSLTQSMVALKRPASGLSPALLPGLLGKVLTRDIAEDELFGADHFSSAR
jgi:N-acetylneuraminate synthase/N,N'-diacetyllegionaminate synthase